MGYQALLFCPDEKTARTVTQVLSELDFAVTPCTEPFAAVKKMMAEHFDAIVVDCDNEQNATLLFKSARNAPNNQSALAVAVVEGQAGVAKAFRIGANLVLTKPINVEQAKGTLRVARGLLRKNESNKAPISTPTATVNPATAGPAPAPAKPVLVTPNTSVSRPTPGAPAPAKIIPTKIAATTAAPSTGAAAGFSPLKQSPQPAFVASSASALTESGESAESVSEAAPQVLQSTFPGDKTSPSLPVLPESLLHMPEIAAAPGSPSPGAVSVSTGAASAPAPAREGKPAAPTSNDIDKPLAASSTSESPTAKPGDITSSPIGEPALAATLTFGGTVAAATEPESESKRGGSKKILLIAVAIVLIAAAVGYAAWTKYGSLVWTGSNPAAPVVRPTTVAVPPSGATSSASSLAASVPVPAPAGVPNSTGTVRAMGTNNSSTAATTSAVSDASHPASTGAVNNSGAIASKAEAPIGSADQSLTVAAPHPPVIKKDNHQPSPPSAARPALQPETPKPTAAEPPMPGITGIASVDNSPSLPNLMSGANSAPTPVLQAVSISQGVSQGLLVKKTSPGYPANALRMHIEGPVELLATISKKGDISTVKVLSGDASLARAATAAVKQWKYKPYLLDGAPVEIQTQITVNFKLPQQ